MLYYRSEWLTEPKLVNGTQLLSEDSIQLISVVTDFMQE